MQVTLYRDFPLQTRVTESREIEISFSSEVPYLRSYGYEILSHDATAVNLARLNGNGAVLLNHDIEKRVGGVMQAYIGSDKKCRAKIKLSRSAAGEDVKKDIDDGILKSVSVGYIAKEMELLPEKRDGHEQYLIKSWEPLEVSFVSVPADTTVGVDRSTKINSVKENKLNNQSSNIDEILAVAKQFDIKDDNMIRDHIQSGDVAGFKKRVLDTLSNPVPIQTCSNEMEREEKRHFSLGNIIQGQINNDFSRSGFEIEVCQELSRTAGKKPQGMLIPASAIFRTYTIGAAAAGADFLPTETHGDMLIEYLRNKSVIFQAGAQILDGLQGNLEIPVHSGTVTAEWELENTAATEGTGTIDQRTASPHTITSWSSYSRKLMLQSAVNMEQFVSNDLSENLLSQIDYAGLAGAGTEEPTGILNNGDVLTTSTGGTISYAELLESERQLGAENTLSNTVSFVTNSNVRKQLKGIFKNTTYGEISLWTDDNKVMGYPSFVTEHMPDDFNVSYDTAILGDFSQLLICMWSGIDLIVDPYSNSTKGQVNISAFLDIDVILRHPESFAIMTDIST